MNHTRSFNIFDHLDQIEVVQETSTDYHCTCPICGDGGFKIEKNSGKYSTFKCGCMDTPGGKKAVINALAPQDSNKKAPRPKQVRTWIYRDRSGHPLVRVCREDFGDGRKPKRWQEHWESVNSEQSRSVARHEAVSADRQAISVTSSQPPGKWVKGTKDIKREDIPIYKYQEIQAAIAQGQTIFIAEGEPACDALWDLGLPATTNIGGSGKWKSSDSKDLAVSADRQVGAKVVLCPDRDKPGVKHTEAIAEDFPDAQWLYAFPNSPFWYNLPANQGLDVADWIEDQKLMAADIWEAVEPRREGLPNPEIPTIPPLVQEHYTQKCIADLYTEKRWIALNGKLRYWTGNHYEEASTEKEKQRIAQWCNTTAVQKGRSLKYAYADASHVDRIWKWLLVSQAVSPDEVNPPGFNCLNGVVKLNWPACRQTGNGRHASWELAPHDPKVIYTYVSEIKFDPDADPTDCDRMLSCLEPSQQKLFIQTMAASLDLGTIRKYRGRKVKALLCKGHGNNGKDTLREAVSLLYGGMGMADASISDFAAYDRGRKFDLAKLEGARINWSSENSSFETLDRLQSLKKAITGESLDCECKGVDSRAMKLATVFLFNVNEAPNLKAGTEAIQSRWAVLEFNKTYKDGADPAKGEIEADSRFRYDPDFLKEKVCPALLNKMLDAIATLAIDGIDYQCTEQALSNIQQETNHLWAFAREVGLDYQTDGRVYINDLWERLQSWYINNGTLEIIEGDRGKEKKIWHDQPRRDDKNVKAPNQVYQRFAELFPKIKKQRDTLPGTRTGQFYLAGIAINRSVEANIEAVEANIEAIIEAESLTQRHIEAVEAMSPTSAEILKMAQQLSWEEQQQLISALTGIAPIASTDHQEGDTASITASTTASITTAPIAPIASTDHQEGDTASITTLPTASIASTDHQEGDTASITNDSEQEEEPKQIDWVRYQGEAWTVSRQDEKGLLWLRKSGFKKVIHTVHVSQVEIGGYKE